MTEDRDAELNFLLTQIERAGVSLEELVARRDGGAGCPTLAEFRTRALDAITNTNTHDTRRSYLNYLIDGNPTVVCICTCRACENGTHCDEDACHSRFDGLGNTPLRSITAADIERASRIRAAIVVHQATERAQRRTPHKPVTTTGAGAATHVRDTAGHVMRIALRDKILLTDPLVGLEHPRRPTVRPARSYEPTVFERILDELCLGGDDPELDALLTAARLETGARSSALLGIRRCDLLVASCKIHIREKRGRTFDKPISRRLMDALLAHVAERGDPDAGPEGPVFHYRPDIPYKHWVSKREWEWRGGFHAVGKSRLETIMRRIRRAVPEANETEFRLHDLRHHVGTLLERTFGPAAAAAYLNHVPDNPTSGYTRSRDAEVEAQHRWLTGDETASG